MTEEDEQWKPNQRETLLDVSKRVHNFLLWLSWNQLQHILLVSSSSSSSSTTTTTNGEEIEEDGTCQFHQRLLVVTHGVWMESLFHRFCPEILDGGKRIHNCDLYRADLVCSWEQRYDETNNNNDDDNGDHDDISLRRSNNMRWICNDISLEDVKIIDSIIS